MIPWTYMRKEKTNYSWKVLSRMCGLPRWLNGKESACNAGNAGDESWSLGWEDSLEEDMATHPSILARRIPWKEYIGLQRVRQNWSQWAHVHVHISRLCTIGNIWGDVHSFTPWWCLRRLHYCILDGTNQEW